MLDPNPREAAAAPASVDTGFDTPFVIAKVNPGPAPSLATVETGFGEPDETPAPVEQATAAVNTGGPANPLPNGSITDWNAINAFIGAVIAWPGSS